MQNKDNSDFGKSVFSSQPADTMSVKKADVKLKMDFDVRDVIDILVSEQEQNIENQISNLTFDLKEAKKLLKKCNKEIEQYIKQFVKEKYEHKIISFENAFKEIGLNASVRFEIIDGKDMPFNSRRPILTSNPDREYKENRIIIALVICNKDFDRNTVDNTVSFYLETKYDDKLMQLNQECDEIRNNMKDISKNIEEMKYQLSSTDRLVRRARAAVTKKAVGRDVESLLHDFRQQYPQELKQILKEKKDEVIS